MKRRSGGLLRRAIRRPGRDQQQDAAPPSPGGPPALPLSEPPPPSGAPPAPEPPAETAPPPLAGPPPPPTGPVPPPAPFHAEGHPPPGPHPPVQFTGPDRRERRDRRASRPDRRTGQPDRRIIRRERRRGQADRRSGVDRRAVAAGIVLHDPAEGQEGVPLAPVGVRRRRRARAAAAVGPRRRARAGAAVVLVALVAVAAVVISGLGGAAGPPEGAATLVPADALAYLHVSTDRTRAEGRSALRVAERFPDYPLISTVVLQRLGSILAGGTTPDFTTEVRPWLGREAALALLNTAGATADTLIVLDVAASERARAFLARHGATKQGRYRGRAILGYPTGTELAFISHYLVLGQPASVRSAIDVAAGASRSLGASAAFHRALHGAPAGRVIDAYASAAGVRRLIVAQPGLIGAFGALLDSPALVSAGLSLSPTPAGAAVHIERALDPALAELNPNRQPDFTPSLQGLIPGHALAVLEVRALDRLVPRVLGTGNPGGAALGGNLGPLLHRLGTALTAEGINTHDVTSLFSGQTAFAVLPGSASSPPAAGHPQPGPGPSLVLIAPTRDQRRAGEELAALEAPLAELFPPPGSGPGRAALFNNVSVAGVTAHQLSLTSGLEFDYAVFRGLVVLSSSLRGIAQVVHARPTLAADATFRNTFADRPTHVTSLLFLYFSQLLSLGEQTGLVRGARLSALRPDLQRIRAIGLTSTGGEADTTAELSLQIS